MFSISKENNQYTRPTKEFICDIETDINNLPVDIAPGSTAIVTGTGSVYILNNEFRWVKL